MLPNNICHVSTFSPTQCGIATYTEDLIRALNQPKTTSVRMIFSTDCVSEHSHSFCIRREALEDYYSIADRVNRTSVDLVSLQHEFGIYGGDGGENILGFARTVQKPIVTTLHTTTANLSKARFEALKSLIQLSDMVVVLTERSRQTILGTFGASDEKVRVIPHGVPHVDFTTPEETDLRQEIDSSLVFVSAGHLRPTKGYENAIIALARYRDFNPDFRYLVLGASQGHRNKGGDEYRTYLEELAQENGIASNIIWKDEYLSLEDLLNYIKASDIGIVPYTRERQSSSGILPIIVSCGRIVIASSFEYAMSVAEQAPGVFLTALNDPKDLYDAIRKLVDRRETWKAAMKANHAISGSWHWPKIAQKYESAFAAAIQSK